MTLDEAIKHFEEAAEQQIRMADAMDDIPMFGSEPEDKEIIDACYLRANKDRQIAEWLKDYKRLLEEE